MVGKVYPHVISASLSEGQYDDLARLSLLTGCSMCSLIRIAIGAMIDAEFHALAEAAQKRMDKAA